MTRALFKVVISVAARNRYVKVGRSDDATCPAF